MCPRQRIETVHCTASNCIVEKRVIPSPILQHGQTRLIMSWEETEPEDLDLYVMAIEKSTDSFCLTNYDNKLGCNSISQDRDNANGGLNGPETVSFLDSTVNKLWTYLVGVEDFDFSDTGEESMFCCTKSLAIY